MSKTGKTVLTIVLVVLIIALAAIMVWGMGGFRFWGIQRNINIPALSCYGVPFNIGNMSFGRGELPANAEKGSQFEAAMNAVNAISMDFLDEDINVVEWDEQAYKVEQTSSGQLSDDDIMRYGILNGKFIAQSGKLGKNVMGVRPKSTITLYIPRGTAPYTSLSTASGIVKVSAGSFAKLDLDSTSGDVSAQQTKADEIYASTTSGRIMLADVVAARSIGTDSTSGTIDVKGNAGEEFNANTTSGEVRFTGSAQVAETNTTSGSVEIAGNVEEISADTISGSITGSFDSPNKFEAHTTSGSIRFTAANAALLEEVSTSSISGSVNVTLPKDAGFYVDYDSISGKLRVNGFMMNDDVYGNGRTKIEADTTSGDLNVESAN